MGCKSRQTRCREIPCAPIVKGPRDLHTLAGLAAVGVICASMVTTAPEAQAAIITDRGVLTAFDHSEIDWEHRGNGEPVTGLTNGPLLQGETLTMPTMEYISQGILFLDQINWVNDGNNDFDTAQAIGGGTPILAIPSSNIDFFRVQFQIPIKGFGFFVANNRVLDPTGPTIVAKDINGNVLETIHWGDAFFDGSIGAADYGFFGLQSDTLIHTIEVTKDAAIFDNFLFSALPSPGPALAFLLAGLGIGSRRQRRNPEPILMEDDGLEAL